MSITFEALTSLPKMKGFFLFSLIVISTIWNVAQGQVTIGAGEEPKKFSALEIVSNSSGGLRLPHLNANERDALSTTSEFQTEANRGTSTTNPGLALGLTIYNTNTNCIEYWDGYKWVSLCLGTADITLSDYPPQEVPEYGGEVGPFTPEETPKCENNPPYSIALVVGSQYASVDFIDESIGQFSVIFTKNTTAKQRFAIVRLTNECTREYKEFIFSQKGNEALCNPTIAKPIIEASSMNNGNALICGTEGSVILGISNPDPLATYIWMFNDIQEVGRGNYIIARKQGSYKVFVGGIGCTMNVSDPMIVERSDTENNLLPPKIEATNAGIICGGVSVTLSVYDFSSIQGATVRWYKDGIAFKEGGVQVTGQYCTANTPGAYKAVIDENGCHSDVSNIIEVQAQAGIPVIFTASDIEINGGILANITPTFCSGGWLKMKIINLQPGITYKWYINGRHVGTGLFCDYQLAGPSNSELNLTVLAEPTAAGSCAASVTIASTISVNEPLDPTIIGANIFCNNNPLGVELQTSSGGSSYLWKNIRTGTSEATTTGTYSANVSGDYKVEITSPEGCVSQTPEPHRVDLIGTPLLQWAIQSSFVGSNQNVIFAVKNMGASVTQPYEWVVNNVSGTANATIVSSINEQVELNFTGAGEVSLSVIGEGYCGKSAPLTLTITVNADKPTAPVLTSGPGVNVCGGWGFSLDQATIDAYDAEYGSTGWSISWHPTTTGAAVGAAIISGQNNRFCYIAFTSTTLATIQMVAKCTADGLTSDPSLPVSATGNRGAVQTYKLNGQECFDIKVTNWEAQGSLSCGQWALREQANFDAWYTYQLTGTLLPTNASDVVWSFIDPYHLVDQTDFTTLNQAKVKFKNHRINSAIIGNIDGQKAILKVTFKVNNGGCTSTYQQEIEVTIRDCDCCTTVTDIDGNIYKTRNFGEAGCWMTENLAVTRDPRGNKITYNPLDSEPISITRAKPVASGGAGYGFFYSTQVGVLGKYSSEIVPENNIYIATQKSTIQGICPDGWVVPSDRDWNVLEKEIATRPWLYSTNTVPVEWHSSYESTTDYTKRYNVAGSWGESMKTSRSVVGIGVAPSGKSTDKGFDAILTGVPNAATRYENAAFMSCNVTASNNWNAWSRGVFRSRYTASRTAGPSIHARSIRCKKRE